MARKKHLGIRKGPGEIVFECINYFILSVIALSMLYPFIYVLAISLNDANDSQMGGIWLYPRVFSLESYAIVFNGAFHQVDTLRRQADERFARRSLPAWACYLVL